MPANPRLFVLLLTGVVLSITTLADAQPEIVPAEHPVYQYLHLQRVAGHLRSYNHEFRPLDRRSLIAHLEELEQNSGRLDRSARFWLDEFRREMLEPEDRIEQVIRDWRIHIPLGRDTEKFFFYHRDDDWRVAVRTAGGFQYRWGDDGTARQGLAFFPEVTFEGNYRNRIGFYSGTWNGVQFLGDTEVLQLDPELRPIYYISRQEVPPGNFDRTSASFRIAGPRLFGEIAHQRLFAGPSFKNPLVLGGGSDYFPFLRLGVDSPVVQYQFLHGALSDISRCSPRNPDDCVLVGPDRFLALHRLSITPARWVSLGFTEMVTYGMRGPELAYLIPVIPLKPAEHALWDRDSAMFTLDAVLRPLRGVEGYFTWLVDDLDLDHIGEGSYNNKWAIQAGLGGTLASTAMGWIEYTRIEPFVYTHRFELDGYFYNTYHHNGFPLGHPNGPNTDQIAAGISVWLPFRTHASADVRYRRWGRNYTTTDGEFVNVGGDLMDGRHPGFHIFSKRFLAGALYSGPGGSFSVSYQPIRSFYFRVFADAQRFRFREMRALRGETAPPADQVDLPFRTRTELFLRASFMIEL